MFKIELEVVFEEVVDGCVVHRRARAEIKIRTALSIVHQIKAYIYWVCLKGEGGTYLVGAIELSGMVGVLQVMHEQLFHTGRREECGLIGVHFHQGFATQTAVGIEVLTKRIACIYKEGCFFQFQLQQLPRDAGIVHIRCQGGVVGIGGKARFDGLRIAGKQILHVVVSFVLVLCAGFDGVVFVAPRATYFRTDIESCGKFTTSSRVLREDFAHGVGSGRLKIGDVCFKAGETATAVVVDVIYFWPDFKVGFGVCCTELSFVVELGAAGGFGRAFGVGGSGLVDVTHEVGGRLEVSALIVDLEGCGKIEIVFGHLQIVVDAYCACAFVTLSHVGLLPTSALGGRLVVTHVVGIGINGKVGVVVVVHSEQAREVYVIPGIAGACAVAGFEIGEPALLVFALKFDVNDQRIAACFAFFFAQEVDRKSVV